MANDQARKLRITLVKSVIGNSRRQKDTVKALGLRRVNESVVQEDNPVIRGMVDKVNHLIEVEEL
jgi:large subunit ribosomal protein L30